MNNKIIIFNYAKNKNKQKLYRALRSICFRTFVPRVGKMAGKLNLCSRADIYQRGYIRATKNAFNLLINLDTVQKNVNG